MLRLRLVWWKGQCDLILVLGGSKKRGGGIQTEVEIEIISNSCTHKNSVGVATKSYILQYSTV